MIGRDEETRNLAMRISYKLEADKSKLSSKKDYRFDMFWLFKDYQGELKDFLAVINPTLCEIY